MRILCHRCNNRITERDAGVCAVIVFRVNKLPVEEHCTVEDILLDLVDDDLSFSQKQTNALCRAERFTS